MRTRLSNVSGYIWFDVNRSWAWKLSVQHEVLSGNNWQLDGLGAAGIANVLSLGGTAPHYGITEVRAQASYRF